MDTAIDYCSKDKAFISSDEPKWIRKLTELEAKYNESVCVLRTPAINDGCIVATFPPSWIKIVPPRKTREMSDEEKAAIKERLANGRKNKKVNADV